MNWYAYYRLARFHKPVGTLLLWSPTAWALWMVNDGHPSMKIISLFLLGTILMRAAGCVMNDIADRQIDLHVQRTKDRPLTSREVSLQSAIIFLIFLLLGALLILLQLPSVCFIYALIALLVTFIYPFCKRFIQCPQLVLGIAFSMGVPMVFAAEGVSTNFNMIILLIINFAWIVAYDTEYAMVDRVDDLRIGVRSTAIFFAHYSRLVLILLQIFFHGLWLLLAVRANFSFWFIIGWLLGALVLFYQQWLLARENEQDYFRAFLSNSWYGLILWAGIVVGKLS